MRGMAKLKVREPCTAGSPLHQVLFFFHVCSVATLHNLVAWNRLAKHWKTNQARVVCSCFMAALLLRIWNIYYDMFQWRWFRRSIDVIFYCFREKSPAGCHRQLAAILNPDSTPPTTWIFLLCPPTPWKFCIYKLQDFYLRKFSCSSLWLYCRPRLTAACFMADWGQTRPSPFFLCFSSSDRPRFSHFPKKKKNNAEGDFQTIVTLI